MRLRCWPLIVLLVVLTAPPAATAPPGASTPPSPPSAEPDGAATAPGPAAESADSERRAQAYGRLMRAMLAARAGRFSAAADEVRKAVDQQPAEPDLLTEGAELLLWTGRRSEGEKLLRRALEVDPDHRAALAMLAGDLTEQALGPRKDEQALAEAIALYERLVTLGSPVDSDWLGALTGLRYEADDLDGAIDAAQRLVDQRPGDLVANQRLAQLLLKQERKREALQVVLRYVADHPLESNLFGFAEQLTRRLELWDAVDEELTRRPPAQAANTPVRLLHAEARTRLGNATGAVEVLERAYDEDPRSVPLRHRLGRAYREVHRFADAAELFAGLSEESPEVAEFAWELARTLELQRDVEGASEAYRRTLGLIEEEAAGEPSDDDEGPGLGHGEQVRDQIHRRLADLAIERGAWDEVDASLGRLLQPDHPEALELAFRAAIERGELDAARSAAKRMREGDQPGLAALLEGELALAERRWGRAESRFREAIDELGPLARRRVGLLWLEAGRPDDGIAVLREAVRQDPADADARYYLGDLLYQADRFEEAEAELREAFRLDPQHGTSLNYLGYSLAERDEELDEALALVQRALETDAWNGAYLDSLGWVYFKMGRYADALLPLERAAREMPYDPVVLEHLGDVYLRLDLPERALESWSRALEVGADDPGTLEAKLERGRRLIEEALRTARDPGGEPSDQSEVDTPRQRR